MQVIFNVHSLRTHQDNEAFVLSHWHGCGTERATALLLEDLAVFGLFSTFAFHSQLTQTAGFKKKKSLQAFSFISERS